MALFMPYLDPTAGTSLSETETVGVVFLGDDYSLGLLMFVAEDCFDFDFALGLLDVPKAEEVSSLDVLLDSSTILLFFKTFAGFVFMCLI